jgi:hypothetical protein
MESKQSSSALLARMFELEIQISDWSFSNSQSNPGAVMHLRDMKRELEKIKKWLDTQTLREDQ